MDPMDLDALEKTLRQRHGDNIRDVDVLSAALYPKVFDSYREFRDEFSDVSVVPTRYFLAAPQIGKEFTVEIERGKTLVIVLTAIGAVDDEGYCQVFFELNGQRRRVRVRDRAAESAVAEREKADAGDSGSVGAPMPGTVIDLRVAEGAIVSAGDALVVLSAMKMETVVASPVAGKISRVAVAEGDVLKPGDLLVEIASEA